MLSANYTLLFISMSYIKIMIILNDRVELSQSEKSDSYSQKMTLGKKSQVCFGTTGSNMCWFPMCVNKTSYLEVGGVNTHPCFSASFIISQHLGSTKSSICNLSLAIFTSFENLALDNFQLVFSHSTQAAKSKKILFRWSNGNNSTVEFLHFVKIHFNNVLSFN